MKYGWRFKNQIRERTFSERDVWDMFKFCYLHTTITVQDIINELIERKKNDFLESFQNLHLKSGITLGKFSELNPNAKLADLLYDIKSPVFENVSIADEIYLDKLDHDEYNPYSINRKFLCTISFVDLEIEIDAESKHKAYKIFEKEYINKIRELDIIDINFVRVEKADDDDDDCEVIYGK